MGSGPVTLDLVLRASGEVAHNPWINVLLPPQLTPQSLPYTCSYALSDAHPPTVACRLATPAQPENRLSLKLQVS